MRFLMAVVNAIIHFFQIDFVKQISVGIISTIVGGFVVGVGLYIIYLKMDENNYHKSTNFREWKKLPSGIWYSNVTAIGSVDHHKLVFGLSEEENQSLSRPSHMKLEMYVDFPVSLESTPIVAQGGILVFGYERVEDFLPNLRDSPWFVTREERNKSPSGYIRERIELVIPIP